MQVTSVTFFAELLNAFKTALDPALDRIYPWVFMMMAALVMVDLVVLLAKTMDGGKGRIYGLVCWVARLLYLSYLISRWNWLSTMIVSQGMEMGLWMAGGAIPRQQFLNPGWYWEHGLTVGRVLFEAWNATTLSGVVQVALSPFLALLYLGAWLCFLGCFFLMACTVFLKQIELAFAIPTLLVLLPFLMWKPAAWIGQGSLTYLVRMAYGFLMLGLIVGITMPVIREIAIAPNPTAEDAVMIAAASGVFLMVFLRGSKMATNIMTGALTLGGGSVAEAGLMLLHTATVLKNTTTSLVRGGWQGASTTLRHAADGWKSEPSIPPAVVDAAETYRSLTRNRRDL